MNKTRNFIRKLYPGTTSPGPMTVEYHKSKIDLVRFEGIKRQYINSDPDPGFSKYLDCPRHLAIALRHFDEVGLCNKKHQRILDIGTGAGYFPFVCKNLGHEAEALDVPDHGFYAEMIRLLGVKRHEHRIGAFEPLPKLGRKYDLVTAFAICFNNHARKDLWGQREWDFFMSDLRDNVVCPGGAVYLVFNLEPSGETVSPELRALFSSRKAIINQAKVIISA